MHAAALVQTPDSVEAMELLLHYGAKTDSRDTWGRTPLMIAAFHPTAHSHEFIKRLILAKADVNAKDKVKHFLQLELIFLAELLSVFTFGLFVRIPFATWRLACWGLGSVWVPPLPIASV